MREVGGAAEAVMPSAAVSRITMVRTFVSLREPEDHAQVRGVVDRLPVSAGGVELDLLGGFDRGLVEAVAEPVDDALHGEAAVRLEGHAEHDVPFDPEAPRLVGVDR